MKNTYKVYSNDSESWPVVSDNPNWEKTHKMIYDTGATSYVLALDKALSEGYIPRGYFDYRRQGHYSQKEFVEQKHQQANKKTV